MPSGDYVGPREFHRGARADIITLQPHPDFAGYAVNLTPEQIESGVRIAAALIALLWLLFVLDRNRWWPSRWSLHLDAAGREPRPGEHGEVAVVVPARNEASLLPRTLPRLLKQARWYRRLVFVDDRSTDHTASSARLLATGSEADALLHVERITEPEPEWTAKTYAMQRGYETAVRDWHGDPTRQWILFTEADILHPTFSIGRLVSKAGSENIDLLSVMVKLRARTFWEWLLIPPFVYFFQLLYPFQRVSAPGRGRAAAAGALILVRRSALEDAGGLEPLRARAVEDVALAQAVKSSGGKCWLGLDPDIRSLRTHDSYGEVREMVVRSAFERLGCHYVLVPIVWLALACLYVAPPLLAIYGALRLDPVIGVLGGLAWLIGTANYLPVVQYLGVPSGLSLTLPVAALIYAVMSTASAWRTLLGRHHDRRTATEIDLTDE